MEKVSTKPFTLQEAEEYIDGCATADVQAVLSEFSVESTLILAELYRLNKRVDDIQNEAQEMMSPDKMMELASGFLGGGIQGGILGQ